MVYPGGFTCKLGAFCQRPLGNIRRYKYASRLGFRPLHGGALERARGADARGDV